MNIRPYVVCHIFAGLNGRIDGAYMLDPAASPARAAYSRMQVEFGADAVAYGAVTTKGFVGSRPLALDTHGSAPKGDFVAPHAERSFYISVDPAGEIAWESATYRRAGRADAHVIEVLTEAASPAYRDYLRERGVSYVLAGSRGGSTSRSPCASCASFSASCACSCAAAERRTCRFLPRACLTS